jgi:riboflavin-specific deaminase-like protein
VLINMAMTADGKITTANRTVSSFGSPRDRAHLLELRATADAVMAGARTVNAGNVTMGAGPTKYRRLRLKRGLAEQNLRIIASGSAAVDPGAQIFKHKLSPILILTTKRANPRKLAALRQAATEVRICGDKEIRFERALAWLKSKWGVRRLLCEGGGELNDALFRAGVVDEIHLTVCPWLFGGRTAPTISDGQGFASLSRAQGFNLVSARRRGREMFFVFAARNPERRRQDHSNRRKSERAKRLRI